MTIANGKNRNAARLVAGTALLVLVAPSFAVSGPSGAPALETGYYELQQVARRYRGPHRRSSDENANEQTLEDATSASSGGALGAALASCEKGSNGTPSLTLPGAKGAIRLDSCYRGRDQFVCSLNTLLDESKKISSEFGHIIEARYPGVASVDAICRIRPDALTADLTKAGTFAARFRDLKAEYDRRIACAMKIEQNLKQVNLGDMPHSAEILKSMNDTLEADLKDVATTRQQIFDLNEKMQASQKAIVTIEMLRPTMCLSTSATTAQGAEKPGGGQ